MSTRSSYEPWPILDRHASQKSLWIAVVSPNGREPAEDVLFGHETNATWSDGPGHLEYFRYRDLLIRIASDSALQTSRSSVDFAQDIGLDLQPVMPFYKWHGPDAHAPNDLFSAVVVNRMEPQHAGTVAGLFAELDASGFPQKMGTITRELYSAPPNVYLHVQEFARVDGLAVIDEAWRDADPRFIKICEDLTPIVPAYDDACLEHEDHLGRLVYSRRQS